MRTVTRDELHAMLVAGTATVVEALSADAYTAEHIPGAVNVPGDLTADLAALIAPEPANTVVVYCSGPACSRSKVTAAAFERLGYEDVRVYPGGKADWWQAGLRLTGERTESKQPHRRVTNRPAADCPLPCADLASGETR